MKGYSGYRPLFWRCWTRAVIVWDRSGSDWYEHAAFSPSEVFAPVQKPIITFPLSEQSVQRSVRWSNTEEKSDSKWSVLTFLVSLTRVTANLAAPDEGVLVLRLISHLVLVVSMTIVTKWGRWGEGGREWGERERERREESAVHATTVRVQLNQNSHEPRLIYATSATNLPHYPSTTIKKSGRKTLLAHYINHPFIIPSSLFYFDSILWFLTLFKQTESRTLTLNLINIFIIDPWSIMLSSYLISLHRVSDEN